MSASNLEGFAFPIEPLLAAARAGSHEALGQLFQACQPYLLVVANCGLGDDVRGKVGASDVVQETFMEAHQAFAHFQGHTLTELLAWLRRILVHNLSNIRRQYREVAKREVRREVLLDERRAVAALRKGLTSDTPSPRSRAIAAEETEQLVRALDGLPEHYRQVVVWHHQEGRTFAEVGQALGLSEEAARKLWARAVARLREAMEPPS